MQAKASKGSLSTAKPLNNLEHLVLRLNPNGMQPLIIASFFLYSIPGLLSLLGHTAGAAAFAAFERGAAYPVLYFLLVFASDFVGLGTTPKILSKYLNSVRSIITKTYFRF